MPSKGQPLHRRKRNLQKSRSRFVGNERRQKNSSCIVGNRNPHQSSPGRAREGRNPLAPRRPRGCRGAERPTLASSERKISREPFPHRRKRMPSKEQPCIVGNERRQKDNPCIVGNERRQKDNTCIVGNQTPRQTSPGRAREGRTPLAPRRPRGCRGAERPTLASSGKKNLKKAIPASSETNTVKRTALHCRKRTSSKGQPLHCRKRTPSKGQPLHRRKPNSPPEQPRESARGSHPSRSPFPRVCRGAERPTPASSGTKILKRAVPALSETNAVKRTTPASSETKLPARAAPGERERDAPLSHPVTRGGVGERSAPRSRRRKQRPQKNSLHRRKPISPPEQPPESSRGCEPSRLPIEAGDLRVGRGC